MKTKLPALLILIFSMFNVSCKSSLSDAVITMTGSGTIAPWDPDLVLVPGVNLVTFTAGEHETTYPYYRGGSTIPIKWYVVSSSDAGVDPGVYKVAVDYSADNGTTWTSISSGVATSSDQLTQLNWTIPSVAGTQYLIRLSALNAAGVTKTIQSSAAFTVSTTLPYVTARSLTPGALGVKNSTTVNRSFFGMSFEAAHASVPIKFYCVTVVVSGAVYANPTQTDPCWQDLDANAAASLNLTNQPAFIGFVQNSYDLRVYVMDASGGISDVGGLDGIGTPGISQLAGFTVAYNPAVAPTVTNVVAANVDTSSLSPLLAQSTFATSSPVYIKWKVSDTDLLATGPISLFYTTDEITFTAISGAQNMSNSGQGGCTVDASYTGCYVWANAPTTGYFRVQVQAVDQTGLLSTSGSQGLNTSNFKIMSGNTDTGLGGSANNATFNTQVGGTDVTTGVGVLAISTKGIVYYFDYAQGILKIDPADGTVRKFIALSSTSTGDGGPVSAATVSSTKLVRINIDYQDRLLILESDRIRRVELDGTINTIIGGGATYDPSIGVPAKSFNFNGTPIRYWSMLQPLPNGNIWFSLNSNKYYGDVKWGVYVAKSDKVYIVKPSGLGVYGNSKYDLVANNNYASGVPAVAFDYRSSSPTVIMQRWCQPVPGGCYFKNANFNAKSGANVGAGVQYPYPPQTEWANQPYLVSRSGSFYALDDFLSPGLHKLNLTTGSWQRILGTGVSNDVGHCDDGTQAILCSVDIADAFITLQGIVYFVDRGTIRVILTDGTIKTIFGQSKSFGTGQGPLAARFNLLNHIGVYGSSNKIIAYDERENFLKEITSSSVSNLAGSGSNRNPSMSGGVSTDLAKNLPFSPIYWGGPTGVFVDDGAAGTGGGNVYTGGMYTVLKLDRADGKWHSLIGGGSTSFLSTATDVLGTTLKSVGYPFILTGIVTGTVTQTKAVEATANEKFVLAQQFSWNGSAHYMSYVKLARVSDGMIRHVAGNDKVAGNWWSDNTLVNDSSLTYSAPYAMGGHQNSSVYLQEERAWLVSQTYGGGGYNNRIVKITFNRDGAEKITGGNKAYDFPVSGARLSKAIKSFNYKFNTFTGKYDVYYCATDGTLNLYSYNSTTAQYVETVLSLPKDAFGNALYKCSGKSLLWNYNKDALVFPFIQNGLNGVGMYCTGMICNY